jgi:hypothetical protein
MLRPYIHFRTTLLGPNVRFVLRNEVRRKVGSICFSGIFPVSTPSRSENIATLYIALELLTEVVMSVTICWDIVPRSVYVNRRFGGKHRLHPLGRNQPGKKPAFSGWLGTLIKLASDPHCDTCLYPRRWQHS